MSSRTTHCISIWLSHLFNAFNLVKLQLSLLFTYIHRPPPLFTLFPAVIIERSNLVILYPSISISSVGNTSLSHVSDKSNISMLLANKCSFIISSLGKRLLIFRCAILNPFIPLSSSQVDITSLLIYEVLIYHILQGSKLKYNTLPRGLVGYSSVISLSTLSTGQLLSNTMLPSSFSPSQNISLLAFWTPSLFLILLCIKLNVLNSLSIDAGDDMSELVISIQLSTIQLMISPIPPPLLISLIHLVISPIQLMISPIHFLISLILCGYL